MIDKLRLICLNENFVFYKFLGVKIHLPHNHLLLKSSSHELLFILLIKICITRIYCYYLCHKNELL